jgi:hypothetical protein
LGLKIVKHSKKKGIFFMKKLLLALICSGVIIAAGAATTPAAEQNAGKSAHCLCKNCTCNPCNCTAENNTCCDAKGDCSSDCGKVAVANEAITKAQTQKS